MTAGARAHATVITAEEPAEVAVGAEFVLTVRVSCPDGCDLSSLPIEVLTPDNVTLTVKPDLDDATAGATHRVALKAPLEAGQHVWQVSCPAHETGGGRHHGATQLRVPIRIRPHETSLAVWSIPSPVVTDRPFAIKVGAKSSAGCDLTGMPIAVCDAAGTVLASGVLGDTPWPGTSALYWTELILTAPAEAGTYAWSVAFAPEPTLAHYGSSSRFSIAIVDPPEHQLTVKVVEQDTSMPVENAQVRLGPYRAATGGSGIAEFVLPKGSYDLNVWKSGYEAPTTAITLDADLAVDVAITPVPEENPDNLWQM